MLSSRRRFCYSINNKIVKKTSNEMKWNSFVYATKHLTRSNLVHFNIRKPWSNLSFQKLNAESNRFQKERSIHEILTSLHRRWKEHKFNETSRCQVTARRATIIMVTKRQKNSTGPLDDTGLINQFYRS